jgi:hypothetical protein
MSGPGFAAAKALNNNIDSQKHKIEDWDYPVRKRGGAATIQAGGQAAGQAAGQATG